MSLNPLIHLLVSVYCSTIYHLGYLKARSSRLVVVPWSTLLTNSARQLTRVWNHLLSIERLGFFQWSRGITERKDHFRRYFAWKFSSLALKSPPGCSSNEVIRRKVSSKTKSEVWTLTDLEIMFELVCHFSVSSIHIKINTYQPFPLLQHSSQSNRISRRSFGLADRRQASEPSQTLQSVRLEG